MSLAVRPRLRHHPRRCVVRAERACASVPLFARSNAKRQHSVAKLSDRRTLSLVTAILFSRRPSTGSSKS